MNELGLWGDVNWKKAEAQIAWYCRNRSHLPDPDNIASRCKPYIDGAVQVGLLLDDNRDVVGLLPIAEQARGKERNRVELAITRLEPDAWPNA